jgi:hypothetical protein
MKYQPRNDLIDPDDQGSPLDFDFDDTDEVEIRDDAYVIGANGVSVNEPGSDDSGTQHKVPSRWLKPAAFILVGLFVVLTIWNLGRLAQGPPLPPKPTAFQSKQALYLGVMKIDAYRRMHGVVPDSLTEAGIDGSGGYEFKRVSPTRYVLSFRNRGLKVEYDSIEPKERFFGSPKDMLTMGDSQ